MRRFILTALVLALNGSAFSQQRWERTYGGTNDDVGYSVQQTTDGGYIVAGMTNSFGNGNQVYFVKTNASGDTLWTRNYGGPLTEEGYSVQQTTDGGYIVAGLTESFGSVYQVYLIKTDATGDTLWTRTYGGTNFDYGHSVQQTRDGGYIVAGQWGGGWVYLIKTNSLGDTLWTKNYRGQGANYGYSVQQTSDDGYIIVGWAYPRPYDVCIIKSNPSGDTLWTKRYGGANSDGGNSVRQTSDNGYIIAGFNSSFGAGNYDVWLIKTNTSGDTLWTKVYGGTNEDAAYSVCQTSDGGYIIAGRTISFGAGNNDVYLIKVNPSGDTLWTKTYGGTNDDVGYSVQQTTDGGYIVAGYTGSFGNDTQVYLIKTDSLGNSTGVEETTEVRGQRLEVRITAKPNPFTSFATLPGHEGERFSLYDVSGRRVGTYRGDRIGEGLVPGVYFLRAEGGKARPVRIVKVR